MGEDGGGGSGRPERRRHSQLARRKGPIRLIAREWMRPGLSSARKRTSGIITNLRNSSRDGASQERVRREHEVKGKRRPETRYLRRESPRDRQELGCRSRLTEEGSGLSQWWRKYGTKKGETTGVDRYVAKFRADKGDQMDGGRGRINGHVAWGFRG